MEEYSNIVVETNRILKTSFVPLCPVLFIPLVIPFVGLGIMLLCVQRRQQRIADMMDRINRELLIEKGLFL